MKGIMGVIIVLFLLALMLFSCNNKTKVYMPLIPMPQQIEWGKEWMEPVGFTIRSDADFAEEKDKLIKMLTGLGFEFDPDPGEKTTEILLKKAQVENPHGIDGAYILRIGEEIIITAASPAGIFYGSQTLKQLISTGESPKLAQCNIQDWPAFRIRGYMQDVGRNYQSPEYLREQMEVMASYKMNTFHMHLADNPGWRLESLKYPELQSDEATSRKPGMYYSREEFVALVDFCAERYITIIPEFDIPGHTQAFRKALNINSMNSEKVQNIVIDLIDELCELAPPEKMPYIHLGTDEVWHPEEKVDEDFLAPLIDRIYEQGREMVGWHPGIVVPGDERSVKQLWTGQSVPLEGHAYMDSRANYLNHMDPLVAVSQLFYQQPCRLPYGDEYALGGILCCWNDNYVDEERNITKHNPVYSGLVTYSEAMWTGKENSYGEKYWAQLPQAETPEYNDFIEFEEKLVFHRNHYFKNLPFPYVKNAHIPWKIIGPFDHKGEMTTSFPVEQEVKDEYQFDGETYRWNEIVLHGGTIHLQHFFGFPSPVKEKQGTIYAMTRVWSPEEQETGFWIGFQGYSRSGGRRGGPTAEIGQWHNTDSKIWVNGKEIEPPQWEQPGLEQTTPEIPFIDEDYFYRDPSIVHLNKGWNEILLKVPHGGTSRKWMFTCVPVEVNGMNVREVDGLKFSLKN
jgi:hexosaminidase